MGKNQRKEWIWIWIPRVKGSNKELIFIWNGKDNYEEVDGYTVGKEEEGVAISKESYDFLIVKDKLKKTKFLLDNVQTLEKVWKCPIPKVPRHKKVPKIQIPPLKIPFLYNLS